MPTKGASNHYGNSRGGRQGKPSSNNNYSWAKDFNKHTVDNHFEKHGRVMGCSTKESYVSHAISFANMVDKKYCESFVDSGGSTYKYSKKTNELVIVDRNGIIVTYFKPKEGYSYFIKQKKGRGK